jgi:hypothetical protein
MVKDRAIYRLSRYIIFGIFCVLFAISVCIFCIFYVFNIEDFLCAFFVIFCVFFFIFLCTFFAFLLPPIVEVDISDIAITSGITNMVKTNW